MASGFSVRLVRLSSSFVGRKGEALYIESWGYAGFLVARLSAAPGITLIPSLTVFCRGGILALGVGELSRLLTGASENVFEK